MGRKKRLISAMFILAAVLLNVHLIVSVEGNQMVRLTMCAVADAVAVICAINVKPMFRVPLEIYRDRGMFMTLVKNDFQARFAGSYLGLFWAYVQPVITIVLYWFVFQFGLRSGNVSNHPFILFLMSGLIPWFYFSESWNGATGALLEYSYLVKKVVFNVDFLPVIKVCSALFVHLFFVGILVVMSLVYGYGIHLYLLQLVFYICCTAFLVVGLSYLTSALAVFFRDITQIVNILLTIGIWLTPIMWNAEATMKGWIATVFKLNPMYYIVDGFRDSILNQVWFWEKPVWSAYFLCVTLTIYLVGIKLFNRLKVHFSDVL